MPSFQHTILFVSLYATRSIDEEPHKTVKGRMVAGGNDIGGKAVCYFLTFRGN